ncbi:MAG: hypothetical protein WDN48_02760 [Pseudolabrys sp.]
MSTLMSNQEILQDLERAHHYIGAIMVRMGIQNLIKVDLPEYKDQVADAVTLLVRVQERMRRLKRSKGPSALAHIACPRFLAANYRFVVCARTHPCTAGQKTHENDFNRGDRIFDNRRALCMARFT